MPFAERWAAAQAFPSPYPPKLSEEQQAAASYNDRMAKAIFSQLFTELRMLPIEEVAKLE